jgi:hypothetical protein
MLATLAVILGIVGLDLVIYFCFRGILSDRRALVAREVAMFRSKVAFK